MLNIYGLVYWQIKEKEIKKETNLIVNTFFIYVIQNIVIP